MKSKLRDRLPILLILFAGTVLRLIRLGADSLWYDETVSVFLAGSPLPELIRHTAGDIHPPGYYILLRGWLMLMGYPHGHADPHGIGLEFAAGFFSLIFGVLLIALVYALARWIAGRTVGLVAGALVAFSPYNVWYSQEVRMYTLGAALGVVALYALLRATWRGDGVLSGGRSRGRGAPPGVRSRGHGAPPGARSSGLQDESPLKRAGGTNHPRSSASVRVPFSIWWVVYALAAAAGMYTLYYFAFLLIPLNLWALVQLVRRPTNDEKQIIPLKINSSPVISRNGVTRNPHSPWEKEPALQDSSSLRYAPLLGMTKEGHVPTNASQLSSTVVGHKHTITSWLLANAAAALLYAPWIPIAWRQATNPPVPPWRTGTGLWQVVKEAWTALSLGQSAPGWLWPALLLTLALYGLGLAVASGKGQIAGDREQGVGVRSQGPRDKDRSERGLTAHSLRLAILRLGSGQVRCLRVAICNLQFAILPIATFGPLALILLVSAFTPLYHVRYLFTYSPAFYVVLAAGVGWLFRQRKTAAWVAVVVWLAASGVTLHAFWHDPAYRADDHRSAVHFLQAHWRPGDVVLVNAGYTYTVLLTYWDGPVASRSRLTEALPTPREDAALVIVTTGHVDGNPDLGWGDPRSDFFALPAEVARKQVAALFQKFGRVWQYRIYDTVNDPNGVIRELLTTNGQLIEDRVYPGEAFMRVQAFVPRGGAMPDASWPGAEFKAGVGLRVEPLSSEIASGATLYGVLYWQPATQPAGNFATSLRLIGPDGQVWAQPPDEQPLGPLFRASAWPVGVWQRQPLALPVPAGTPPGPYTVELVVYDPVTGQRWPVAPDASDFPPSPNGISLGTVTVTRPQPGEAGRAASLAQFGPLALLEATSPATQVAPGGAIPVELLWQAIAAPGEPLVEVLQLLDQSGLVVANLEAQPASGRYPTQAWHAGELVRDKLTLNLPPDLSPGDYRLIVGIYRAGDRQRLETRSGMFGTSDHWTVRMVAVR